MAMVMYDKNGNETTKENQAWIKVGARYYIKCSYSRLVNPDDLTSVNRQQWRQVSEITYKYYLQFLKTRKQYFLTQAQRTI